MQWLSLVLHLFCSTPFSLRYLQFLQSWSPRRGFTPSVGLLSTEHCPCECIRLILLLPGQLLSLFLQSSQCCFGWCQPKMRIMSGCLMLWLYCWSSVVVPSAFGKARQRAFVSERNRFNFQRLTNTLMFVSLLALISSIPLVIMNYIVHLCHACGSLSHTTLPTSLTIAIHLWIQSRTPLRTNAVLTERNVAKKEKTKRRGEWK